jgi:hypothetical protein
VQSLFLNWVYLEVLHLTHFCIEQITLGGRNSIMPSGLLAPLP